MINLLGNIFIAISLIFIFFGVVGIYRYDNFYSRALVSAKIDTVGFITLIIGLILKYGLTFSSLKLLFILVMYLVINPLTTHSIVKSAYSSGYKVETKK